MADTVTIPRRYRGPPESANGGYACGVLAGRLAGPAAVTLRSPPPLDEALIIEMRDAGRVVLLRNREVIADGSAAEFSNDVPAAVDFESAGAATASFPWKSGHPFPGCFVCGPDRAAGDGLRIFPGPVAGRQVVAAPWVPDPSVCDEKREARLPVMWAALDCPSWFGLLAFEPDASRALLGRLTARVRRRAMAGEPCVAIGWSRGRDGRKLNGGAALFGSDGDLLGSSEAVWIEPRA